MEFLEFIFVAILVYCGTKALWISTLIIEERKKNYKAGTHDYYGNKIEDEWSMTSMQFALILMFCIPVVTWYLAVWLTDYFDGKK